MDLKLEDLEKSLGRMKAAASSETPYLAMASAVSGILVVK